MALVGIFAAELALFCASAGRHYSWVYPRWSDQLQYLREAYGGYDQMQSVGFLQGARHALATVSPQGSLHGFLGMAAFEIGGPSRTAALAVNMVAFICLQAATFVAVRRVSGSFALAWAAVGFLAALHSPWSDNPGSANDFRLDWMAACAYGVALAAAVASNGFRSTRWAVLFGIAVGIALLVRHLTAVYFGLIYVGVLAWLLFRPDRWRRSGRLVLSGICALAISGWAFWRSWHNFYEYYWINRFVGPESTVRDSHMSLVSYARWLASETLFHQLGPAALLLAVAAGALFLAAGLARGKRDLPPAAPSGSARSAWPVVLAFLAAPAAVLLIHPDKAPQTLNIMIPAATWMIFLAWTHLARRASRGATIAICAAVASAGSFLFVVAQVRSPFAPGMESEYRDINALSDFLYFRAQESGLSRPSVAVTWVSEGMNAESFEVVGRERHRTLLPFVAMLPTGVLHDSEADVMSRLAGSDFVCLVTRAPVNWPFDREMESMLPGMRKWCDANLRHDGDLETVGFSVSIYERRALARPGAGGGVDLAAMMSAASRGPANSPAALPGPPVMTTPGTVFWTTQAECRYVVRAAYSPVRYRAEGLPGGMNLDPLTGEIRGYFHGAGKFGAVIEADNAAGSSKADVTFLVSDQPWDVSMSPPVTAPVNVPIDIGFEAFDSRGMLDFIDVSDLTEGRLIYRVSANDDERLNWQGVLRVTLREPGEHRIKARFVRYDPAGGGTYSFLDRECVIVVGH